MMRGKSTALIQRDCRLSHKMQASYLVSPTIVGCDNGMLLSTLKLDGVHLDTLPATEVQSLQALWHQVIVSMNDRCACHVTSHRNCYFQQTLMINLILVVMRDSYQQQFNEHPLYVNDYYLTVIHLVLFLVQWRING